MKKNLIIDIVNSLVINGYNFKYVEVDNNMPTPYIEVSENNDIITMSFSDHFTPEGMINTKISFYGDSDFAGNVYEALQDFIYDDDYAVTFFKL